jgi:TonB family protein
MFARPKPAPFAFSLVTHGLMLAWMASGPVREQPKSLYAEAIAPHASKLVWYNFREKLPEVSPPAARKSAMPLRAEVKIASQEIVVSSAKTPTARQFVWQPAPKPELNQDLQSPNLVTVHPPHAAPPKPRQFVPPAEAPRPVADAPKLAAPPEIRTARSLSSVGNVLGVQPVKAPPRKFVAPRVEHPPDKPALVLPDAPALAGARLVAGAPLALGRAPVPPRRAFVPPSEHTKPSVSGAPLPNAPALSQSASAPAVSLAIVGLDPNAKAPAPAPEGSRDAHFSAGPQPRDTGGTDGTAEGALLTVPGLLVRNATPDAKSILVARAAPTTAGNLRAAVHGSPPPAAPPTTGASPAAVRAARAPDSLLNGRTTYAMSVQMPNTTSYAGSWMIWFAQRQREPGTEGALSPPVPLRKVDPKYYPAAIADQVEGNVRLIAVIRKDGHVDSIRLLQHLDDRLDESAAEAMEKWQFEPALRNGQAVDVDAVIEIPFRLAPIR